MRRDPNITNANMVSKKSCTKNLKDSVINIQKPYHSPSRTLPAIRATV